MNYDSIVSSPRFWKYLEPLLQVVASKSSKYSLLPKNSTVVGINLDAFRIMYNEYYQIYYEVKGYSKLQKNFVPADIMICTYKEYIKTLNTFEKLLHGIE